jgi:hypothetical protein
MHRLRSPLLSLALCISAATSAHAQNAVLTQPYAPGGGVVTAFGYYMSPYTGTIDGTTERLNCVDFFHDVSIGEHWTATITNIGAAARNSSLLLATRDGSSGGYASLSEVLQMYEEAAWLTDQYSQNPSSDPNRSIAIQTAIWSLVDNGPTNPASLRYESTENYWSNGERVTTIDDTGTGSTGYWISQAQTKYALQSDEYYDRFNILTGTGNPGAGAQEFVYSATPEPSTFVLIGSALIGVAAFKRIRKHPSEVGEAVDQS